MFWLFCKGLTDKWYFGICQDFPTGLLCQVLDVFFQLHIPSFFSMRKIFFVLARKPLSHFFLLIKNAELIIEYSIMWVIVGPWTVQRLGALTSYTVESQNITSQHSTYTDSQPRSWLLDCVGWLNCCHLKKRYMNKWTYPIWIHSVQGSTVFTFFAFYSLSLVQTRIWIVDFALRQTCY